MEALSNGPRLDPISLVNSGPYSITGITTKNTGSPSNVPVSRKVRLHNQATGLLVAQKWSAASDGSCAFYNLAKGVYHIIAFDHTGIYNGELVTDIVVPQP